MAREMDPTQRRFTQRIRERDPGQVLQALKGELVAMVEEYRRKAGKPNRPAMILVDWSLVPSIKGNPEAAGVIKFGATKHFRGLVGHVLDNNDRLDDVLVREGWSDRHAKVLYGSNRIAVAMIAGERPAAKYAERFRKRV